MYDIEHYCTADGKDIFQEYLDAMRDVRAHVSILRRIDRVRQGNFGDHKSCREGVLELRIDVGQGYRVYYTIVATKLVLLLCAGDKKSQDGDIDRAVVCKMDYLQHTQNT